MLNPLRNEIDKIDSQITDLLIKRYKIVEEIAKVKEESNIPVEDLKREKSSIDSLISNANLTDSQANYIKNIFPSIHKASKDVQ